MVQIYNGYNHYKKCKCKCKVGIVFWCEGGGPENIIDLITLKCAFNIYVNIHNGSNL